MQINDKNLMLWQLQSKNNTFLKDYEDTVQTLNSSVDCEKCSVKAKRP